jgi:hypothetical protein
MNNNKPGTPYTQTQYVIANKRQRDKASQYHIQTLHKQYMTNKDYDMLANRLKRYVQSVTTDYTSYSRRGKSNRWVCVNSRAAGTLVNGAIVMDISKLLALGGYGNKKHASTMHKIAHKIKVNALKSVLVMGDKYITYGN